MDVELCLVKLRPEECGLDYLRSTLFRSFGAPTYWEQKINITSFAKIGARWRTLFRECVNPFIESRIKSS
jgi:hypothetical protein